MEVVEALVQVGVVWICLCSFHGPREVSLDLGEPCSESIECGMRFVFFVIANAEDSGEW